MTRILLPVIICLCIQLDAQHNENITQVPKMLYGDTTRLGKPFAKDPHVVHFNERYLMYYSIPGLHETMGGWGIGIAASSDLIHWEKVGEITSEGEYEKNGLAAPSAIVLDEKVHLFYQTYGNWEKDAICHSVSDDGIHFSRNPSNPNCSRSTPSACVVMLPLST